MLMLAEIVGGWTLRYDDQSPELIPTVADRYGIRDFVDVTSQPQPPTEPDLFSLLVRVDSTVLDAIRADPDFLILWEEAV